MFYNIFRLIVHVLSKIMQKEVGGDMRMSTQCWSDVINSGGYICFYINK